MRSRSSKRPALTLILGCATLGAAIAACSSSDSGSTSASSSSSSSSSSTSSGTSTGAGGAGGLGAGGGSASTGGGSAAGGAGGEAGQGQGGAGGEEPGTGTMRRLVARHYKNSIRDILGPAAAAVVVVPPDVQLNGFEAIGASQLSIDDSAVAQYERTAWLVADAAIADKAKINGIAGCTPAGADDAACISAFIGKFGRLAFRRTLPQSDIDIYLTAAMAQAADDNDAYSGIVTAIGAILQSPDFIYEVELGRPSADDPNVQELAPTEVATRMSFFLLDTSPDAAALDAAESGGLDTQEAISAMAADFVSRPSAKNAVESFFDERYRLRDLQTISKDLYIFPAYSSQLMADMRAETLRVIRDLVWTRDSDFRELLTANYTFVSPSLAAFYGLPAPGADGKVILDPNSQRMGLTGQGSFLSLNAHSAETSPTLRGKFVREVLMCESIPPPPPGVVPKLGPAQPNQTMRQRLMAHQADPTCAGCHELMDNIGLGLENFDAIGAFRDTDGGAAIDASGEVVGLGTFATEPELGALLHDSPEVAACLVLSFFRQARGHLELDAESTDVAALVSDYASAGYRVQPMLVDLASSKVFRRMITETP